MKKVSKRGKLATVLIVIFLIALLIPIGTAMENTGAANYLSDFILKKILDSHYDKKILKLSTRCNLYFFIFFYIFV